MGILITFAFLQINFLAIQFYFLGESSIKYAWLSCPLAILASHTIPTLFKKSPPIRLFIFLFGFVLTLHTTPYATSLNIKLAAASLLSWGAWIPLAILLQAPKNDKDRNPLIQKLFYAVSIIHSVFIIIQNLAGLVIIKSVSVSGGVERSYGIGHSVSITAIEIGIGIIAALYLLKQSNTITSKIPIGLTIVIQIYALLLTGMRGPLFLTIIGVSGFLLHSFNRSITLQKVLLTLTACFFTLIVCITFLPFIPEDYRSFYESSLQTSSAGNSVRIVRWQDTIDQITSSFNNLILGTGSGSTNTIPNISKTQSVTNESSLLKVLLETGLLGLTTYALVVLTTARTAFGKILQKKADLRHITITFQFLIVALECLINDMLNTWIIAFYFWALIGLINYKPSSKKKTTALSTPTYSDCDKDQLAHG